MTKSPLGFGLVAIAATASLAVAGGDEEKKLNSGNLDRLASAQGGDAGAVKLSAMAGKGVTIDGGDSFMLNLVNRVQPYYAFAANDGAVADTSSFSIKRARTRFSGHIYNKDIKFRLQTDWVEGTSVKDAWLHWMFMNKDGNAVGLRFGQQKTFFGREATGSSGGLEFVDRSLATRVQANGRSRGAALTGEHAEGKFHWTAGVFNTDTAAGSASSGEEAANPDNELDYVFTIRLDPNGDMGDESYMQADLEGVQELKWSVGAGLQIGNHRAVAGATTVDVDGTSININAGAKIKGFHVLGEVFIRSDEADVTGSQSTDSTGFVVGGTYTLPKQEGHNSQWGFGARYSMVDFDKTQTLLTATGLGSAQGDVSELTVAVSNYYRAHAMKTQASWTLQEVNPNGGTDLTNHIFELQVTFVF